MSFTVYKSSAGSGKTFTLVKEYLCLVIVNPYRFRSVLAITFTNKAADEMKQRILQTLNLLSDYQNLNAAKLAKLNYLLPELKKQTGLTEAEIIRNSQLTLSLILHNYSNFAISTIDSFVHKIVRTFANDLNLPVNFSVELDGENLISQAVDLLINQLGNQELLTDFLFDYAKTKIDEDKSWHIETDLKAFARILLEEESQLKIEKLNKLDLTDFKLILNKLNRLTNEFIENIAAKGIEVGNQIKSHNIPHEAFYQGKNGISAYFDKIANKQISKPNRYVGNTIEENKWTSAKASSIDKASIESIKDFITSKYYELLIIFDNNYETYIIRNAIQKNIYSLALLNEIEKFIKEIRENEYTVHISEFNKRISEIVINEPIPFIYERLGEKYKHFLIDEFQDTSVLQWLNLLPLIDNSLAEDQFNMIVGDGKQAIYRFRGGEVEQFALLPELYNKTDDIVLLERENSLKRNFEQKNLKSNYRSKAEIVEFNNQFFQYASSLLDDKMKIIYSEHSQEYNNDNSGGLVSINFIINENPEEYSNLTHDNILETILELQNDDYQWRDICILCRNNMQANKIAGFLTEKNISVISNESLLLKSAAPVRVLISLLKLISNFDDLISRAHILMYIVLNKEDKEELLCKITKSKLLKLKTEKSEFENFLKTLGYEFSFISLSQLTLYQLCENLIVVFFNQTTNPYLQFFLDNVLNFTTKNSSTILDFLVWWDKKKDKLSLKTPTGINAVNIMTIHKSKGLEFKVVIFPYADEKQRKTKDSFWIDVEDNELHPLETALVKMDAIFKETCYSDIYTKEDDKSKLDLINLLYVALTRPSDRLYIFTQIQKSETTLTLSSIFKNYLISLNLWSEFNNNYRFGNPQKQIHSTIHTVDNMLQLKSLNISNWQQKIKISHIAPAFWQIEDPEKNRRFGNIIHWVLSKIENSEDIKSKIDSLTNNIIQNDDKNALKKILLDLSENDEIKFLFDKKYLVKNEAEILLKNGKTIRPDKILISDNETIIIDFKTGKQELSHRNQLEKYELSLKEMKYKNIIKCLIYINEKFEIIKW
jgi:ATP-dependent exoDNAse (exonuclease V) beta subunit